MKALTPAEIAEYDIANAVYEESLTIGDTYPWSKRSPALVMFISRFRHRRELDASIAREAAYQERISA